MKILVIQQKMIGDVLTSSILFEALKKKYPNAQLHYLINSYTIAVVKNNPHIDKLIILKTHVENNKLKFINFLNSIRKSKYDIVVDVYAKLSSNLITLFSNAPTKISYQKKYKSFIYDYNIERETHKAHSIGLEITNRLLLLKPLQINASPLKPHIFLTTKEIEDAKAFLKLHHINFELPIFMISVLGSSDAKTYPLHYMAKVIDEIVTQSSGQILFNYIPSQKNKAREVYQLCKKNTQKHIKWNIFKNDLREFLAVTKLCTAVLGNEGGAINMAKALSIPTFSIFAPWIDKTGWNMFEDGQKNTSLHLKDFKPELFDCENIKALKNTSENLYYNFLPKYVTPKLQDFLQLLIRN